MQCDQIGQFLKGFGDIASTKSSPKNGNFLAIVTVNTFHIKLLWLLFGQLLERKIWDTSNLASGHPSLDGPINIFSTK